MGLDVRGRACTEKVRRPRTNTGDRLVIVESLSPWIVAERLDFLQLLQTGQFKAIEL